MTLFWVAAAVVAGPVLGVGAAWSQGTDRAQGRSRESRSCASILVGEAVYGLTVIAGSTSPAYWTAQLIVGLGLDGVARPSPQELGRSRPVRCHDGSGGRGIRLPLLEPHGPGLSVAFLAACSGRALGYRHRALVACQQLWRNTVGQHRSNAPRSSSRARTATSSRSSSRPTTASTGLGDATLNGRELAVVATSRDHVVPLLIGRDAAPHRGHLAVPLPRRLLAARPGHDGGDRRGRHGAVGHQGQGRRDAGLPAARRRLPHRAARLRPRVGQATLPELFDSHPRRTRSRATARSASRPACPG